MWKATAALGDAALAVQHLQMIAAIAVTRCRSAAAEPHRDIVEPAERPMAVSAIELED